MKEKLEQLGWTCSKCACTGKKGYDCANKKYKGTLITLRQNSFRIVRNSLVVEAGVIDRLESIMKKQELI